jgi:hypothetical protein
MRWTRRVVEAAATGLRGRAPRLPFFTQRTAVLLLGVLVATLALLGGVVAARRPHRRPPRPRPRPPRAPSSPSRSSSGRSWTPSSRSRPASVAGLLA